MNMHYTRIPNRSEFSWSWWGFRWWLADLIEISGDNVAECLRHSRGRRKYRSMALYRDDR